MLVVDIWYLKNKKPIVSVWIKHFSTEYSSDPGEDVYSNIEVDDLYDDMIMSENEAIRVRFSKD